MKKIIVISIFVLIYINQLFANSLEVKSSTTEVKTETKEVKENIKEEKKEEKEKCDRKYPVINRLLAYKTKGLSKELFHPVFLEAISVEKLKEVLDKVVSENGFFEKAECLDETNIKLYFSKSIVPCKLYLSSDDKVAGIWFGTGTFRKISLKEIEEDFKKLDGSYSVCAIKGTNEVVFEHNSSIPMAVGSAFKLYVLKAVANKLEKEKKNYNEVVQITSKNKSNKESQVFKFPEGSYVTLNTLAHLMISLSDNTATDHLIDYVTKEEIEKILPESSKPFLSTKDFFNLKFSKAHKELTQKYIDGSIEDKRKILNDMKDDPKTYNYTFSFNPTHIDTIEWLISTQDLCKIIYSLKDNNSLTINPGILNGKEWDYVGYKGGSEFGVINFTYVVKKDGKVYTVSITLNNDKKKINKEKFVITAKKLFDYLNQLK